MKKSVVLSSGNGVDQGFGNVINSHWDSFVIAKLRYQTTIDGVDLKRDFQADIANVLDGWQIRHQCPDQNRSRDAPCQG
jgi:hypothetical protein